MVFAFFFECCLLAKHKAAFLFFNSGNLSPCKFEKVKSKIKGIFKFREKVDSIRWNFKKIFSFAFENDIILIREIFKLFRISEFIFRHVLNFLYDPETFNTLNH